MKAGASDYLTKPLQDPEELRHVVRRVFREPKRTERFPFSPRNWAASSPPRR